MPRLYNFETNSYVEVPENRVREMVLSKKYAFSDADKVPVIAPDGSRHMIPGVKAMEAFNHGGQYGSSEDWDRIARKEKYGEGWENYLGATLTGAARGATLGASDLIAREVLGKERMETWRDELSGISTGAEIGGAIAPAFFTGGASAAGSGARLAAQGVKASDVLLASKGAFKLGKAAEKGIANSALLSRGADKSKALQIVQGAMAKGTGGAIEGGLFGAGTTLSEHMLGDPDEASEMLLANIGYSALFGGLGNAGIHTIGVTGAAAGKQMSEGVASLYEKATGNKMSVAAQEKFLRGTGSLLGVEDTDTLVKQLSWAPEHRAARKTAREAMDSVGDKSLEIYGDLNTVLSDLEAVQSATRGTQKRKEMLGQLFTKPSGAMDEAWVASPQEAIEATRKSLANMWETLESLRESQIKYKPSVTKKDTGHLVTLEKILAGETGANADEVLRKWSDVAIEGDITAVAKEAYLMLDDFKKYLGHQAFSSKGGNQLAWNAQGPMIKAWQEVHQLLENPNIWGRAAETQRKVNAKFSPFIKSLQGFRVAFGERGEKELISNNKLRSFLKNLDGRDAGGLDSLKGLNREATLRDFYRTAREYIEVANENYGLKKDGKAAYERLSKRLPGSQEKIDGLVKSLKESRFIREAAGGQGFNPKLAAQIYSRFGNAALGGLAFGPVGVAAGLILGGIADGASAARKLAHVEYMVAKSRNSINKRLDDIVERMTKGGPGGSIPLRPNRTKLFLAPLAAQFGEDAAEDKSNQEYYATAKQRAMNLGDPETLGAMADKVAEPINHEMPNLSAAVKTKLANGVKIALDGFTKDNRTANDRLMGAPERQPTDRELAQQEIRLAVLEDPIGEFCGALESGTCTKTHSETMQRAYPNLFLAIKAGLYERFSDRETPVSYQWKIVAGIAFGEAFDVSQKPENMNVLQSSYTKPEVGGKIKSSPLIKHPGLGPTEVERIMMG